MRRFTLSRRTRLQLERIGIDSVNVALFAVALAMMFSAPLWVCFRG
jgi:hypothetical protein